jgi:probable selenium-dependent hydroxylase accessory protein YqeC
MIIAVIGAGGKTTISNQIGQNLAGMGRRVLFTTTTKIYRPADSPIYIGPAKNIHSLGPFMTAAHHALCSGKLEGYHPNEIAAISALGLFDDIIVEADGAARKPIKAPNETEPVYPASTNLVIGVIGLDCIGQKITEEHVHRAALFSCITRGFLGEHISWQHIVELIKHSEGLFRYAPAEALKVVFINKYDRIDEEVKHQAENIIRQSPYPVIITGYNMDWFDKFYRFYVGGQ